MHRREPTLEKMAPPLCEILRNLFIQNVEKVATKSILQLIAGKA